MSENVTCYLDLASFSTHAGPGGRRMAQITLPDTLGDTYSEIPAEELDRMCIEWIRYRISSAIRAVGNQPNS